MQAHYKNSDELCEAAAAEFDGTCLLSFSCGKDAVASWLQLKRHFKRIIPINYAQWPDIEYHEKVLRYYEKFFDTRIVRLIHPKFWEHLYGGTMQTREQELILARIGRPAKHDFRVLAAAVREDLGLPANTPEAVGMRVADSLNRRAVVKMHGSYSSKNKTFFPVFDWDMNRLVSEIQTAGVKLPPDYLEMGRSLDGVYAQYTRALKRMAPQDFEAMKRWYPLVEADMLRREWREDRYLHAK